MQFYAFAIHNYFDQRRYHCRQNASPKIGPRNIFESFFDLTDCGQLHKSLLSQKARSNLSWMPEWWDFLWFTFKPNIKKLEKSWCSEQPDSVDFEFFSAAHAHASHESKAVHIPSIHWTLNYLGGTCMNQKLNTFWAFHWTLNFLWAHA